MMLLNNSDTAVYFRKGEGGKRGVVPIDFPMRIVELREGDRKFLHSTISRGIVDGSVWIMATVSRVNRLLNELEPASGRGLY